MVWGDLFNGHIAALFNTDRTGVQFPDHAIDNRSRPARRLRLFGRNRRWRIFTGCLLPSAQASERGLDFPGGRRRPRDLPDRLALALIRTPVGSLPSLSVIISDFFRANSEFFRSREGHPNRAEGNFPVWILLNLLNLSC